jgi:hypothetical protein
MFRLMLVSLTLVIAGANAQSAAGPLVPADAERCSDQSFYTLTFRNDFCDDCIPNVQRRCEPRSREVCREIQSEECELVLRVNCRSVTNQQDYIRGIVDSQMQANYYRCENRTGPVSEFDDQIVCTTRTKNHCMYMRMDGGVIREMCQPESYEDCEVVPRVISRSEPSVSCTQDDVRTVPQCTTQSGTQSLQSDVCEIVKSTNCVPRTATDCKTVVYEECWDEFSCTPSIIPISVPEEKLVQKVNCLVDSVDDNPDTVLLPAPVSGLPNTGLFPAPTQVVAGGNQAPALAQAPSGLIDNDLFDEQLGFELAEPQEEPLGFELAEPQEEPLGFELAEPEEEETLEFLLADGQDEELLGLDSDIVPREQLGERKLG